MDGNRTNNVVSNLEWGTRLENVQDTIKHGRHSKGESHGMAKLNDKDVRVIRYLLSRGASCYSIAPVFKVSMNTIADIRDRKKWGHVIDVEDTLHSECPSGQGVLFPI